MKASDRSSQTQWVNDCVVAGFVPPPNLNHAAHRLPEAAMRWAMENSQALVQIGLRATWFTSPAPDSDANHPSILNVAPSQAPHRLCDTIKKLTQDMYGQQSRDFF